MLNSALALRRHAGFRRRRGAGGIPDPVAADLWQAAWSISTMAPRPKSRKSCSTRSWPAYAETYANVHRGAHFLSGESTVAFEKARESARSFVNAAQVEEIIFTKGGTEAINLVASSLGADIVAGDEIIISEMEHHSNIVPWHFLRERKGADLLWAPLAADDSFDLDAFAKLLSKKTKIVAITHMSNVLGTVTPVARNRPHGPCGRRQGADRRLPGQRA